jgi:enoyl-[acyl-carrier protein] reductase I
LGAELAVTYLDERARPYVEPLAKELQASIFMPLNVDLEGQTEKVFERIEKARRASDEEWRNNVHDDLLR